VDLEMEAKRQLGQMSDVFPTLTVSFVSLRLSRSGNGVDEEEVFVMVAA
jgi:hypothetical protein